MVTLLMVQQMYPTLEASLLIPVTILAVIYLLDIETMEITLIHTEIKKLIHTLRLLPLRLFKLTLTHEVLAQIPLFLAEPKTLTGAYI